MVSQAADSPCVFLPKKTIRLLSRYESCLPNGDVRR